MASLDRRTRTAGLRRAAECRVTSVVPSFPWGCDGVAASPDPDRRSQTGGRESGEPGVVFLSSSLLSGGGGVIYGGGG